MHVKIRNMQNISAALGSTPTSVTFGKSCLLTIICALPIEVSDWQVNTNLLISIPLVVLVSKSYASRACGNLLAPASQSSACRLESRLNIFLDLWQWCAFISAMTNHPGLPHAGSAKHITMRHILTLHEISRGNFLSRFKTTHDLLTFFNGLHRFIPISPKIGTVSCPKFSAQIYDLTADNNCPLKGSQNKPPRAFTCAPPIATSLA